MKCIRCQSIRLMKFVDGFGDRRIFCKSCGGSFLENVIMNFVNQSKLHDFNESLYYNLRALRRR